MAATNDLESKIRRQLDVLDNELKKPGLWPVKRKVYKMIANRLEEVRSSIFDQRRTLTNSDENRILDILDAMDTSKTDKNKSLPESTAWDIADSLKEILPRIASEAYLYSALVEEKQRTDESFNWKDYFDEHSLSKHISSYESEAIPFNRELVANRLITLYRLRNDLGRHNRARDGVRSKYLWYMGLLLAIGVLIVIGLWYLGTQYTAFWLQLFMVAISGAIGAILSRAMRLRDINRIVELKSVRRTLFPQAIFGAILAVIVILILKSKIITIAGIDLESGISILFVIGFISGFSEPFALGILEKISSMGK